jgi:hypothetical protein
MDNSETLDNLRKRMMARLANSGEGPDAGNVQKVLAKDQNIRKAIAEFFLALNELQDPQIAVDLLAEHVAILVEMINKFKNPDIR